MNRMQKISWLNLIVISIALVCTAIAMIVLYTFFGFPIAWAGIGFMGITGIAGFGPFIFKKEPGSVRPDERDRFINMKAALAAFGISYLVFGVLCMGIWYYYQFHSMKTIAVGVLPMLFVIAGITVYLIHAIMILILYGKGGSDV